MAANFTGYLLPWDQLAYWAVTICTSMLGYVPWIGELVAGGGARRSRDRSRATLVIFYAFHTTLIPVDAGAADGLPFLAGAQGRWGVVDPRPPGEIEDDQPEWVSTLPDLLDARARSRALR